MVLAGPQFSIFRPKIDFPCSVFFKEATQNSELIDNKRATGQLLPQGVKSSRYKNTIMILTPVLTSVIVLKDFDGLSIEVTVHQTVTLFLINETETV